MNPVIECIYSRRSVRDFLPKIVPNDVIMQLLNAGVMAPSAMNTQPWRFSVVTNKTKISDFNSLIQKESRVAKYGIRFMGSSSVFYNAPLLIVISGRRGYSWLYYDINLCVQNMFLAARSLGLGSCYIGLAKGLDKISVARKELGVPDSDEVVSVLIFGYPKRVNVKIPRRRAKILAWID